MTDQSNRPESHEFYQLKNAPEVRHDQLSTEMARIYKRRQRRPGSRTLVPFLTRALLVLAVLLTMRFVIPSILEELQYAVTRGQQRAKFESAVEALDSNPLNKLSLASQMVSQRVAPSVVHIEAMSVGTEPSFDDASRILSRMNDEHNQGSGVIVSHDGFIVTNLHVIANTSRVIVTLSDGRQFEASPVGVDQLTDLAVVKIEADNLIPATWDDSDLLEEGALVWAVGSPFGFQHSITSGIVSAKNRSSRAGSPYQDFLQTDAAVNPGNSGGPLVNAEGRIVGINTMIVGPSFQGISLAIPSNVARRIYKDLKTDGQVARGWLGITLAKVTPEVAEYQRLASTDGAMVKNVVASAGKTSPAFEAGIRADDVIVQWDGVAVKTTEQLFREIAETEIGREVEVMVIRDGLEESLFVKVGDRPETPMYKLSGPTPPLP